MWIQQFSISDNEAKEQQQSPHINKEEDVSESGVDKSPQLQDESCESPAQQEQVNGDSEWKQ